MDRNHISLKNIWRKLDIERKFTSQKTEIGKLLNNFFNVLSRLRRSER